MGSLPGSFEYKERFGRLDKDKDIIKEFYEPVLENSIRYDRACGYFSSTSLALASKGFSKFCENPNSRMRLIAGAKVQEKDKVAILNSKEYYEKFVTEILKKELITAQDDDDFKQYRLMGMAWMIEKGILDIKICLILDEEGRPLRHRDAEFHPKFGILEDVEGNLLHFEGGINESERAWHQNWDSICVHASWEEKQSGYIKSAQEEFDALWNVDGIDKDLGVSVISLPEAAKQDFLEFFPPVSPSKIKEPTPDVIDVFPGMGPVFDRLKNKGLEEKIHVDIEKEPEPKEEGVDDEKWGHQQVAADLFLADKDDSISAPKPAGRQGILCMATGSGKTRTTVEKIINKMIDNDTIDQVIVTTNSARTILPQWDEDFGKFCPDMFTFHHYKQNKGMSDFEISQNKPKALLTSIKGFEKFLDNNPDYDLERCLLVVDECHNFRGEGHRGKMVKQYHRFQHRLGLSATPYTAWNKEANDFLDEKIGDVFFEFTVEEAIRKHILVPFKYEKLTWTPTEEDIEEVNRVRNMYYRWIEDGKAKQADQNIAISDVYKKSETKLPVFRDLIIKDNSVLERCVIFLFSEPYGKNLTPLITKHGGKNATKFHVYYGGDKEIQLERFRENELDCLVTCKMLNEGVDVPSLNTVILVSSDGGAEGVVTTQRIGRALRYDEDNPKKMARVIDFVRTNIKEGENEWERTEWLEELSKIRPDGWSD